MTERIRYTNQEIGGELYLVSANTYTSDSGLSVKVYIKVSSLEYHILDTVARARVLEGSGSSLHKIKKKAKMNLQALGINFVIEKRPGRKKRTPDVSTSELLSSVE